MKILFLFFFRISTHTVISVRSYSILFFFVLYLKSYTLLTNLKRLMTKEKFNSIVSAICAFISALGAAISTLL